jgi:hypothetical protein
MLALEITVLFATCATLGHVAALVQNRWVR